MFHSQLLWCSQNNSLLPCGVTHSFCHKPFLLSPLSRYHHQQQPRHPFHPLSKHIFTWEMRRWHEDSSLPVSSILRWHSIWRFSRCRQRFTMDFTSDLILLIYRRATVNSSSIAPVISMGWRWMKQGGGETVKRLDVWSRLSGDDLKTVGRLKGHGREGS